MTNQVMIAISSDFLTAFARLPKNIQGKVTVFLNKFRLDPLSPGINYEKLNKGIDKKIYSVRIDDTYRGIVAREPETGVYLLLWVDHHDEAYDWANRKRCEVNKKTGTVQIFDVQTIFEKSSVPSFDALFNYVSDEDLLEIGVPKEQISFVRSFKSENDFFAAKSSFPQDVFECLSWLTEGIPVSEVIEYANEERGSDETEGTLFEALKTPTSLKSFVVVEGENELKMIMAEPFEKWRVFLHPTQRKIVNQEYTGPARILGGAGTGKTVVAIHRAKHLAEKLPCTDKILLTTFTANLAADIRESLKKICSIEEIRKIDVIHLDAWVNQFLRETGFSAQIDYDNISSLWEKALLTANIDLPFETAFYEEEWNRVVISQEALSLEKYIKASRTGRGTQLDRKKRILVWKVFEVYQSLMEENKIRDINTAMYECSRLLRIKGRCPQYASIIVDEGQDFSDNAYRLLRALAGEEHENDIFIVGDTHQRIYRNRPTLSHCGINIRGRSSLLKINYRTTEEIRKYASSLLKGIPFDDLDDSNVIDDLCQSLTHGEAPRVLSFNNAKEELNAVHSEIQKLIENKVAAKNICVVARTHKLLNEYITGFTAKGLRCYEIKGNKSDDRGLDGIRAATMHRVKGLEFQYVFVVAVNNRILPLASAINHTDKVSERESITSEKCLLYVALTRAQKGAFISGYGKMSEFLQ